jgi:phage tail sheath protein FI
MPTYDVPGVYIEEQTNLGVITGVGTSTAAFIGPARRGPMREPQRISSFDEFLALYADPFPDGTLFPYITQPQPFYMAHAIEGFYKNGGTQAYVVRVGTGVSSFRNVNNRGGELAFIVEAQKEGTAGDAIQIRTQEQLGTARAAVVGTATLVSGQGTTSLTVNNATPFKVGDAITKDETARATITGISGNVLTISVAIPGLNNGQNLHIANLTPTQNTLRVDDLGGLIPGTVVRIDGEDAANPGNPPANPDFAVIQNVDPVNRIVTFRATPPRAVTYRMDVAAADAPKLTPFHFRLTVTPPSASGILASQFDDLSLEPSDPGYIFSQTILDRIIEQSSVVRIKRPQTPPVAATFPQRLTENMASPTSLGGGANDQPGAVSFTDYQNALNVLADVDDVNLLCIPDAASHSARDQIQLAMKDHCLKLKDRFAIFDSSFGALPAAVEQQRALVESEHGYAALYYPWLKTVAPIEPGSFPPPTPVTMFVPPSGHMAGIYARIDQERGVHKAPANTAVRGVLGLERVLSDGQQGPLNLQGINVLRIFPGTAQVIVWGARTTANKNDTDWIYINVRRLMLFLEESIEESLKFSAVFEPNNLALWQKLKRILNEFLERVWRDGALFGAKPEQAFRVRIDEALNPASTRALGRLYIEIAVAAVRPAEFIIVRIGLSRDGASEVSEG